MTEIADMMVKRFPVALRQRIGASAKDADETMAEWFVVASENELNRRAGIRLTPPGKPEVARPVAPIIDRDSLMAATTAMQAMAQASQAGLPVSKTSARHAMAVITAGLREMRGLPSVKKRHPGPNQARLTDRVNVSKSEFNQLPTPQSEV